MNMDLLKIVIEEDIKITGDGDIVEIKKRLSSMESEKLFIDLFGTINVGVLDCSNMTDAEIDSLISN